MEFFSAFSLPTGVFRTGSGAFRQAVLALVLLFLALFSSVGAASDLELSTRLLDARPGSWTRYDSAEGYVYTRYVVDNDGRTVVLRLLRHHHHRLVDNQVVSLPYDYIRSHGIDPDSLDAVDGETEHDGVTYSIKKLRVDDGKILRDFYFSNAIPVDGILRVDFIRDDGHLDLTRWHDQYGFEPDERILRAGEGENANAEYGVPDPE